MGSRRAGVAWEGELHMLEFPPREENVLTEASSVIYPLVIRSLIPRVGFAWTVRAIALIVLLTLAVANIVLMGPPPSQSRRALIHSESLRDWPYVAVIFGYFAVFLGLYTPFFYVQSFALNAGITSSSTAFYIVAAMNLFSILGRILPNIHLADWLGPMNMIILTVIILAVTALGFIRVTTTVGVFVCASVYGFFTGTFFALQPTIFVRLTSDLRFMGTRFGMAFSIMSFALLFGSPISGVLQRAYGYDASWIWGAATLLAGSVVLSVARVLKIGPGLVKRF